MWIAAESKINLYLKVTAKRADGYHELKTLFLPLAEPSDEVALDFAAGIFQLECDDPALPSGGSNLAGRAALLYAEESGIAPEWCVRIVKRIPVAAGMGGGSADAAAVLRILNRLYHRFSAEELAQMALSLGADVPFFLEPLAGFATGVGENLEPFDFAMPDLPILIVNPRFPVSAKWAFTHLDPARIGADDGGRTERLASALRAGDLAGVAENLHNDLAFALYDKFPLLVSLRDDLCRNGALNAEITGSGPTLYAICPDWASCDELAKKLDRDYCDALVIVPGRVAGRR